MSLREEHRTEGDQAVSGRDDAINIFTDGSSAYVRRDHGGNRLVYRRKKLGEDR